MNITNVLVSLLSSQLSVYITCTAHWVTYLIAGNIGGELYLAYILVPSPGLSVALGVW